MGLLAPQRAFFRLMLRLRRKSNEFDSAYAVGMVARAARAFSPAAAWKDFFYLVPVAAAPQMVPNKIGSCCTATDFVQT
jgi:hypothetical protein